MKSQKHNEGELCEFKLMIDKCLVDSFYRMSKNSKIPVEDLVTIALKRFRASHSDYDGVAITTTDE